MDDCPSKDVYHQLQSLSKHNPCFVQSLQSIMTQNIMAEETPDPTAPSDPLSSNQAVLALLLAAHLKPSQGVQQGAASVTGLIKQLEAGTSAVELLKTALAAGGSSQRSGLLPSPGPAPSHHPQTQPPPDLSSLISSMTSLVSQGKLPAKAPVSLGPTTSTTKNPQLMNMLYSAFQVNNTDNDSHGVESQGFVFQARITKQHKEVEGEGQPGGESVEAPAAPCYALPSPYCPVYPGGQQYPPPPPGPGPPGSSHSQSHSPPQSQNLNQILAMPPPPPPPPSAYTEQGWQVVTQPGQGLLFSPVLTPPVWPHHPHHPHHHHPALYLQTTQKRKMEEYLPAQVSNYSDVENQTSKRQKV